MNFKEILELIDKVADSGIAGVEVEQAGTKVRIEGKATAPHVITSYVSDAHRPEPQPALPPMTRAQIVEAKAEEKKRADEVAEEGLHIINSPIVGTFYRAANPEAPPFVNVGDRVQKGQVLCIIEAMKLMNEIESDADGVIVSIHPQNGQPVEYGEKLVAVRV